MLQAAGKQKNNIFQEEIGVSAIPKYKQNEVI